MKRLVVSFVLFLGLAFCPNAAHAQSVMTSTATNFAATCQSGSAIFLGLRTWDACLEHSSGGAPKITALSDIWLIVLVLIEDAIVLGAYIAAGFVIWGGIQFIKSQGDPGQINQSKQTIFNALMGLALALASVAIVNFIAGSF